MGSPGAQELPDVQQRRGPHYGLLGEGGEGGAGVDHGVGGQVGLHDVHDGVGVFDHAGVVAGHGEGLGAGHARGEVALVEGRHGAEEDLENSGKRGRIEKNRPRSSGFPC